MTLKVEGNTVLITGGATGIGFALAEAFVKAGSEVILCGRRRSKLQEAKSKIPSAHIRKCDVSVESERKKLLHWCTSSFPSLDILVNNAGIQRQVDFTSPEITKRIPPANDELAINLESTIRLCALFAPKFLVKKRAAIVNISSGLAFVPNRGDAHLLRDKSGNPFFHNLPTPPTQRTHRFVYSKRFHRRPTQNLMQASLEKKNRPIAESRHRRLRRRSLMD